MSGSFVENMSFDSNDEEMRKHIDALKELERKSEERKKKELEMKEKLQKRKKDVDEFCDTVTKGLNKVDFHLKMLNKQDEYFDFRLKTTPEHPLVEKLKQTKDRIAELDAELEKLHDQREELQGQLLDDAELNADDEYIEELKRLWNDKMNNDSASASVHDSDMEPLSSSDDEA
jgi:hypothetical protein